MINEQNIFLKVNGQVSKKNKLMIDRHEKVIKCIFISFSLVGKIELI